MTYIVRKNGKRTDRESKHRRLHYQPLFGKGARAPLPKFLFGEEGRPDARERRKSSLKTLGNTGLMHGLNNRGAHRVVHKGTHLEIYRERNVWWSSCGGHVANALETQEELTMNKCDSGRACV